MLIRRSILRRYIDRAVMRELRRIFIDAGVKGMKRGEHRMAKDPDYLESLHGGGGKNNNLSAKKEKMKKIGKLVGGGAALLGAGLLGRKLGMKSGFKLGRQNGFKSGFAEGNKSGYARGFHHGEESGGYKVAQSINKSKANKKSFFNSKSNKNNKSSTIMGGLSNFDKVKKALNDPNYVLDI